MPHDRPAPARAAADKRRRLFWMQQLRRWHWISSAICLAGMLMFAATGITLNHASTFEPEPTAAVRQLNLPPAQIARLAAGPAQGNAPLPAPLRDWIGGGLALDLRGEVAEWSAQEVYLSLARPGGEATLIINRGSGAVVYETSSRGVVGVFNDLHMGRNTGHAWRWFIDIFAAGCLVFATTGLLLLGLSAPGRPQIWPLLAVGLAAPLILAVLMLHGR